ncbi:Uncharacterised protein [Candidatus Norongarragalina meridionalis]|nr:Uncharacterised protein [Candidatus Norongarragalina meridionalis]
MTGNKITVTSGYGVKVTGSGAYLYGNAISSVLFDAAWGVVERGVLDSVEAKNGAEVVMLNTRLAGCEDSCPASGGGITTDVSSKIARQWWVAFTLEDTNGNPLDGTVKMTSKTGAKYTASVKNGKMGVPFNATEHVFGGVASGGMEGNAFEFAGLNPGEYNPYGWEACSGDNCETGDASFVKETVLPVIIKNMFATPSPSPSAPPGGEGAPSTPLPQGTYFKVARHTGLQLGNTYEATVSLLVNGTGICDPAMTLSITRDGQASGAGSYKSCNAGQHIFTVDTKTPGTYRLVAHSVINGQTYDSWSETVTRFGQPPKATPEMTPLLALGAALFAFWAISNRRKR